MKYRLFLKIKVDPYPWFIQIAQSFELNTIFNTGNRIMIDDLFGVITDIFHDIDDDVTWINIDIDDPTHVVETSNEAIERLKEDAIEFKKYGYIVNDYDLGNYSFQRVTNDIE